ncbi:MAG TPA: hypothetical protein VFO76_04225 [Candidatus Kapabacteria bacterium]|nr:hypothetical protein [Candidatus Kapabacteria bacterium]
MKNTLHPDLFEFEQYGLTVYLGENIGDNAVTSMRHAYSLAKNRRFGEVIYLNTYQSEYKLDKTLAAAVSKHFTLEMQTTMQIISSTLGELANERGMMAKYLAGVRMESPVGLSPAKSAKKNGVNPFTGKEPEVEMVLVRPKVIIINSWEFAAKDCRHRERLLFMINEWVTVRGISVIIYAEDNNRTCRAGKLQRGGFGKLMGLADMIVSLSDLAMERDAQQAQHEEALENSYADQHIKTFHARRMMFIAAMMKANQKQELEESKSIAAPTVQEGPVPELPKEEKITRSMAKIIMSPGLSFGKDHPENAISVEEFLERRSTLLSGGVHSDIVEAEEVAVVG